MKKPYFQIVPFQPLTQQAKHTHKSDAAVKVACCGKVTYWLLNGCLGLFFPIVREYTIKKKQISLTVKPLHLLALMYTAYTFTTVDWASRLFPSASWFKPLSPCLKLTQNRLSDKRRWKSISFYIKEACLLPDILPCCCWVSLIQWETPSDWLLMCNGSNSLTLTWLVVLWQSQYLYDYTLQTSSLLIKANTEII